MGEILKRRLKSTKFASYQQEVVLNLALAANYWSGRFERVCTEFGISGPQYNILRILKGTYPGGYPCGEIGVRMIDRAPDITRRLDALEKNGLIERIRSTEDRRVVITRITTKGLELLDKMYPAIVAVENESAGRLTKEECLELSRLCEKIYAEET